MTEHAKPDNPVTVARRQVEAQIPPEKRGPGWDRHWRELEHYAEAAFEWSAVGAASSSSPSPGAMASDKPRRRRRRAPRSA